MGINTCMYMHAQKITHTAHQSVAELFLTPSGHIYVPLHAGRLKVEDKYLQEDLGPGTALEYFIPTTTGPGACTFALVHYLTYIHNNFIDWCRAKSRTRLTHLVP